MKLFNELLNKVSKELSKQIIQFYDKFYSYTLDLLSHKNIDLTKMVSKDDDEINILLNSINSALNTTGIPIIELSNHELLDDLFKDAILEGEMDYKTLFENVGKKFINRHLLQIILEYLIDYDSLKIENLDLFDLLPPFFKLKLDVLKRDLNYSFAEKEKMKSLISNIHHHFDASMLKFKKNQTIENDEEINILKKLQEAKERNLEVLGQQEQNYDAELLINKKQDKEPRLIHYFEYFGSFPVLEADKLKLINIDIDNFRNIASNLDIFMDLENLFYYISTSKILGLENIFKVENVIAIMKNFIKGNVFSSSIYHMPNPMSNFYGLSILSELKMLKENHVDFVDFLDIEMFLESEIKHYFPSKLSLNYYTFLSLKLLENSGITIIDKENLLEPQLTLDFSDIDSKSLPRDILYHLTLIKLINKDHIFNDNTLNLDFKNLLSPNSLINDNLTDSARALLIYDIINQKEQSLINNLINAMLSNYQGFIEVYPQFNWMSDKLALKTELRMLFWLLVSLLRY